MQSNIKFLCAILFVICGRVEDNKLILLRLKYHAEDQLPDFYFLFSIYKSLLNRSIFRCVDIDTSLR